MPVYVTLMEATLYPMDLSRLVCLAFFQFGNDIRRREVAQGRIVLGFTHLDYPDEVALEVAAVGELKEFRAGEPAVN